LTKHWLRDLPSKLSKLAAETKIPAEILIPLFCVPQEDVDLDDVNLGAGGAPVTSQPREQAGGQPVFAMPPPSGAVGVNPFTGAPVAANENTSLNTTEQTTYTPGI